MRDLYLFLCMLLYIALARSSSGRVTKSQGGSFRGFLPHWQRIVQHSIWDSYKNDWTDRFALWDDEFMGLARETVCYDPRRGRGNFWGNMCHMNCKLDCSMQRCAHDRGRRLISSVGLICYRPRTVGLRTVSEVWCLRLPCSYLSNFSQMPPTADLPSYLGVYFERWNLAMWWRKDALISVRLYYVACSSATADSGEGIDAKPWSPRHGDVTNLRNRQHDGVWTATNSKYEAQLSQRYRATHYRSVESLSTAAQLYEQSRKKRVCSRRKV